MGQLNAVGCETGRAGLNASLFQQAEILVTGKTQRVHPQCHGRLRIVGVQNLLPVFRPVVAEFFHHPDGVTETGRIVCRLGCAFPFCGPEYPVHQAGQVRFVQGPAGFDGFIEYGVGRLLAESQLEQGHQHQVMDDAVRFAQGLFQPAIEFALQSVKPAARTITKRLEFGAFVAGQAVQGWRKALGQGLAVFHGQHHACGDGAHGLLSVSHVSAAPGRASAVLCRR